MGPWFEVAIGWTRHVVAAVVVLPRSHTKLPPNLARGSYTRKVLRLNQRLVWLEQCLKASFAALVMALSK